MRAVYCCSAAAAARPHRNSCRKRDTAGLEWATGARLLSTRQAAAFFLQLSACSVRPASSFLSNNPTQPTFPRLRHVIPRPLHHAAGQQQQQQTRTQKQQQQSCAAAYMVAQPCMHPPVAAVSRSTLSCVLTCLLVVVLGRLAVLVDPLRTDHRVVNASRPAEIPVDLRAATASACALSSTPSSRLARPLLCSMLHYNTYCTLQNTSCMIFVEALFIVSQDMKYTRNHIAASNKPMNPFI